MLNLKIKIRELKLNICISSKFRSITIGKFIFQVLSYSGLTFKMALDRILKTIWHLPLFSSMCEKVGKNLNLIGGSPFISTYLDLYIGDNVTIYGDVGFQAEKVEATPTLIIGNNSYIGPSSRFCVAKNIKIGNNCLIGARCYVADNDSHPTCYIARRNKKIIEGDGIKPITIGNDVWIGEGACILKGVTIGNGAIVAARAVIVNDVSPFTVVAGNPAKEIKKLSNNT